MEPTFAQEASRNDDVQLAMAKIRRESAGARLSALLFGPAHHDFEGIVARQTLRPTESDSVFIQQPVAVLIRSMWKTMLHGPLAAVSGCWLDVLPNAVLEATSKAKAVSQARLDGLQHAGLLTVPTVNYCFCRVLPTFSSFVQEQGGNQGV
jgi:hypothetical protein